MADVFHRIYTHAALDGFDTTGGRAFEVDDRDAARILPRDALAELDDLLRKTTPDGREAAWVVRRFVSKSESYACVITSYPDIFTDAGDRSGVLNHARVLRGPVDDSCFDVASLVEVAEDVDIGEICSTPKERRLRAYLDQLSGEPAVVPRPVSIAELQQLPRQLLESVLIACLVAPGRREKTRFRLPPIGIRDLAIAWAALPIGLQRTSTFAVSVDDGCPVDAVFSTSSGQPPEKVARETLAGCVHRYVELLLDSPHDFTSLLRNREIDSVTQLNEIVNRRMIVAPLKEKNRPRARGNAEPDELDPQAVTELDRQFRAMEARTRAYVDERLANFQTGQLVAAARSRNAGPAVPWLPIAGVAALIVIAALYVLLWKPARDRDENAPIISSAAAEPLTTTEEELPPFSHRLGFSEAQHQTLVRGIDAASASGQWAETLKVLIQSRGAVVATALRSTAQPQLVGFAEQIEDGAEINRDSLRRLLLEHIAGVAMDGKQNDVTPVILQRVKDDYGVTGTAKDAKDIDLQSEIILRWMERRDA